MIALITMQELQSLTAQQLGEMHQLFTTLLTETSLDTAERRNILATLENIERAMGYTAKPAASRRFTMKP